MRRTSKLKILGVIGDPIEHSLSPLMHNAALAQLKLPYLYMPFHVKPEELTSFFQSLSKKNIVGFNVTIPHKQAVLPLLNSLTRESRLIGAANTILVSGGKTKGANTDGAGYLLSLKNEAGFLPKDKNIILLGAGGAARAIAVALGMSKAREVTIFNRTEKTAHDLAEELSKRFPNTHYSACGLEEFGKPLWKQVDLLINATSLGMKKGGFPDLPLSHLPQKALVSDIVYNPRVTDLLKKSKKLGLPIHEGWGMLLYQGALAFEHFTGKKAPVEVMKRALLEALYK